MMKIIRISLLLAILLFSAFYSKLQRLQSTSWVEPLPVAIYPINADGRDATTHYINALDVKDFKSLASFFNKQWTHYSELDFEPVSIQLMPALTVKPPSPPSSDGLLQTVFWSLRLRYWAYQHSQAEDKVTVNIFIQYQQLDPDRRLAHSLGLQKGLIGLVNAYADKRYQETNNVVIAHELLHTVGASDKYDLSTGQPIYPEGFAIPSKQYQQNKAELMAARIPLSATESEMPISLRYCVMGEQTAAEVGWVETNK
ncbi:MAG: hypothetical protein AB1Y22_09180 [Cycloclasticus sp.]